MNPLEILYSWQSLFLAIVIAGITQSVKHGVDIYLESRQGDSPGKKTGREIRQQNALVNNTLLPLFPLFLGSLLGAFLPIQPEPLVLYVTTHRSSSVVYAMWGASVGQFADYIFQRAKQLLDVTTAARVPTVAADPPVAEPSTTETTFAEPVAAETTVAEPPSTETTVAEPPTTETTVVPSNTPSDPPAA